MIEESIVMKSRLVERRVWQLGVGYYRDESSDTELAMIGESAAEESMAFCCC